MCEKCYEIEEKIERYRQVQRTILDQLTVDRAKEIIAELETHKVTLHPELGSSGQSNRSGTDTGDFISAV